MEKWERELVIEELERALYFTRVNIREFKSRGAEFDDQRAFAERKAQALSKQVEKMRVEVGL